jgi:excisionase family DNA binding protein
VDKLLTPEQVAERLAVSPYSVRKWLRSGRIKGIKIASLWRIRESDLETFIQDETDREGEQR